MQAGVCEHLCSKIRWFKGGASGIVGGSAQTNIVKPEIM